MAKKKIEKATKVKKETFITDVVNEYFFEDGIEMVKSTSYSGDKKLEEKIEKAK